MGEIMSSYFLNKAEKDLLESIDRLIDWHESEGKPLKTMLLSLRQAKAFTRLAKKAEKYDKLYFSDGDVDIRLSKKGELDATRYRGVAIYAKPERRRYSKKSLVPLPL